MNSKDSDIEALRKEFVTREEFNKEMRLLALSIQILRKKINAESTTEDLLKLIDELAK